VLGRHHNARYCGDTCRAAAATAYGVRYGAAYRAANPDKHRQQHLIRMGTSLAAYDALLAEQGGTCAYPGCGISANRVAGGLGQDHDHATGRVRAILCANHNRALGVVEDAALLAWALAYIAEWQAVS